MKLNKTLCVLKKCLLIYSLLIIGGFLCYFIPRPTDSYNEFIEMVRNGLIYLSLDLKQILILFALAVDDFIKINGIVFVGFAVILICLFSVFIFRMIAEKYNSCWILLILEFLEILCYVYFYYVCMSNKFSPFLIFCLSVGVIERFIGCGLCIAMLLCNHKQKESKGES